MKSHIIPLFVTYQKDENIVYETLKLMVMLTLPPDKKMRSIDSYVRFLQSYKDAFLKKDVIAVIMNITALSFEKIGRDRTTRDIEILELVLTLMRNLLATPDVRMSYSSNESHLYSLQDLFISCLEKEHFLTFLIALGNNIESSENKRFVFPLIEIIYFIFRKEDPYKLADLNISKDKEKLGELLKTFRKKQEQTSSIPTRHSRFGGCFVSNSISGSKKYLNNIKKAIEVPVKLNPNIKRVPRNNKALQSLPLGESNHSTKSILKKFANKLISHCLNEIISVTRNDIIHGNARLLATDHENFAWLIGFFSGYIAHINLKKQNIDYSNHESDKIEFNYIANCFDEQMFTHVLLNIDKYFFEKNVKKLSLYTSCLKQLITSMYALIMSDDFEERSVGESLFMKLVYKPDVLLEKIVYLLKNYVPSKIPRTFVCDLIESAHYIITILEKYVHSNKQIVQLKKRTARTTNVKKDETEAMYDPLIDNYDPEIDEGFIVNDDEVDALDDVKSEQKNDDNDSLLSGELDNDDVPVDTSSNKKDIKEEEPIKDELNFDDISLPSSPVQTIESNTEDLSLLYGNDDNIVSETSPQLDEDEDDATEMERYFEYDAYLGLYCRQSIIRSYMMILRTYEKNDYIINEAIAMMFQRMLKELKAHGIFFQVSYLRVINSILNEKRPFNCSEKLKAFSCEVIRSMVDMFRKNPMIFVSNMLFSKNRWEAEDMILGSLTNKEKEQRENEELDRLLNGDYKYLDLDYHEDTNVVNDKEDNQIEDFDLDELLNQKKAEEQLNEIRNAKRKNTDENVNYETFYVKRKKKKVEKKKKSSGDKESSSKKKKRRSKKMNLDELIEDLDNNEKVKKDDDDDNILDKLFSDSEDDEKFESLLDHKKESSDGILEDDILLDEDSF